MVKKAGQIHRFGSIMDPMTDEAEITTRRRPVVLLRSNRAPTTADSGADAGAYAGAGWTE